MRVPVRVRSRVRIRLVGARIASPRSVEISVVYEKLMLAAAL